MAAPSIMWFRQDLRLADHPALCSAAAKGPVVALYILDDETPESWKWGGASRWWLHRSLEKLSAKIPLVLRCGRADEVIASVIKETNAVSLHFTRDYAPWSNGLETRIKQICDAGKTSCHRHGGYLLHEPESIRNGSGQSYKVYTPFSRACFALGAPRDVKLVPEIENFAGQIPTDTLEDWNLLPTTPDWSAGLEIARQPGEASALKALHDFLEQGLADYARGRDRTDQALTSRLSPHLHWGEISPVQVWHATRHALAKANGTMDNDGEKFLKEILWREFSYHLLHHFPQFPDYPFKPEFEKFPWADDKSALKSWQHGKTGYPIVDAGMRELWETGTMHNRVRMVVASFLIKDLLLPWQEGARWFWDTLVDADIASNSAGWQWVAGSGADASPYYRVFNPVLQGQKFDPEGAYVKKWLPELAGVSTAFIHTPWLMPVPPKNYPPPMIDHGKARDRALEAFKKIKKEILV